MKDKLLCVMAGYDDDTEKYLTDIQNRIFEQGLKSTHTKNIPQHITIGTFDIEKQDELVDILNSISQKIKAFEITFNHIGIFNGSKVLFIAPDANRNLIELREMFDANIDWTPHTTMLMNEPNVVFEAMPIVLDNFQSFRGKIDKVYLYEFWPANEIIKVNLL